MGDSMDATIEGMKMKKKVDDQKRKKEEEVTKNVLPLGSEMTTSKKKNLHRDHPRKKKTTQEVGTSSNPPKKDISTRKKEANPLNPKRLRRLANNEKPRQSAPVGMERKIQKLEITCEHLTKKVEELLGMMKYHENKKTTMKKENEELMRKIYTSMQKEDYNKVKTQELQQERDMLNRLYLQQQLEHQHYIHRLEHEMIQIEQSLKTSTLGELGDFNSTTENLKFHACGGSNDIIKISESSQHGEFGNVTKSLQSLHHPTNTFNESGDFTSTIQPLVQLPTFKELDGVANTLQSFGETSNKVASTSQVSNSSRLGDDYLTTVMQMLEPPKFECSYEFTEIFKE